MHPILIVSMGMSNMKLSAIKIQVEYLLKLAKFPRAQGVEISIGVKIDYYEHLKGSMRR